MVRSTLLFIHVASVIGMFAALAIEWLSVASLRHAASRAEAIAWSKTLALVPRIGGISGLFVVASGLAAGARIGVLANDWMRASYLAIVVMAVFGGAVTQPRLRRLRAAADDAGDASGAALRAAGSDWVVQFSVETRIAFALAIVYLMVAKPAALESTVVLSIAVAACALLSKVRASAQPASAARVSSAR